MTACQHISPLTVYRIPVCLCEICVYEDQKNLQTGVMFQNKQQTGPMHGALLLVAPLDLAAVLIVPQKLGV